MPKVLVDAIVGARPNMMKMAPLARALADEGTLQLRLIHTGQHYDQHLSGTFFDQLGLRAPDFNLGVGSGSQGAQVARILEAYERILMEEERPRGVLVVGDVNSTMACTLAAAKLNVPVAHVEAGLRSGDRTMPEEINRIVTDALSDLLFVSDPAGIINLVREGRERQSIYHVGNIMIDTLMSELPAAASSTILDDLGLTVGGYAYLTLHRPANVDDPEVLRLLVQVLTELSCDLPFVFPVHPRTRGRLDALGLALPTDRFRITEPLGYRENLRLIQCARVVLTDSGGIQEETSALDVPCLTLRNTTERPVTVDLGSSELVGCEPARIRAAWQQAILGNWKRAGQIPLWDGRAADRIVGHLRRAWGNEFRTDDILVSPRAEEIAFAAG